MKKNNLGRSFDRLEIKERLAGFSDYFNDSLGLRIEFVSRSKWDISTLYGQDKLIVPVDFNLFDLIRIFPAIHLKYPEIKIGQQFEMVQTSLKDIDRFLLILIRYSVFCESKYSQIVDLLNTIRYSVSQENFSPRSLDQIISEAQSLEDSDSFLETGGALIFGNNVFNSRISRSKENKNELTSRLLSSTLAFLRSLMRGSIENKYQQKSSQNSVFLKTYEAIETVVNGLFDDLSACVYEQIKLRILKNFYFSTDSREIIGKKVPALLQTEYIKLTESGLSLFELAELEKKKNQLDMVRSSGDIREAEEIEKQCVLELNRLVSLIPYKKSPNQPNAWIQHKGFVCAGFAYLMHFSLDYLGIVSTVISPMFHMKNIVIVGELVYEIEPQKFVVDFNDIPELGTLIHINLTTQESIDIKKWMSDLNPSRLICGIELNSELYTLYHPKAIPSKFVNTYLESLDSTQRIQSTDLLRFARKMSSKN